MVINKQRLDLHTLNGTPYRDSGMVVNMQWLGGHSLSGTLHRCPDVVMNEQGFSHVTRRLQEARKLVDESRIRLCSWNVGFLTGRLREMVNTMPRKRVNVLCSEDQMDEPEGEGDTEHNLHVILHGKRT